MLLPPLSGEIDLIILLNVIATRRWGGRSGQADASELEPRRGQSGGATHGAAPRLPTRLGTAEFGR